MIWCKIKIPESHSWSSITCSTLVSSLSSSVADPHLLLCGPGSRIPKMPIWIRIWSEEEKLHQKISTKSFKMTIKKSWFGFATLLSRVPECWHFLEVFFCYRFLLSRLKGQLAENRELVLHASWPCLHTITHCYHDYCTSTTICLNHTPSLNLNIT